MNWKDFTIRTKNLKNTKKIFEILNKIPRNQAYFFLNKILEDFSSKTGQSLLISQELERVLFNIPSKYYKTIEFERLLKLYTSLFGTHSFKGVTHTIPISDNTINYIENDFYVPYDFNINISKHFHFILGLLLSSNAKAEPSFFSSLFSNKLISTQYTIGTILPGSNDEKIHNFTSYGLPFISLLNTALLQTLNDPIDFNTFFITDQDKILLRTAINLYKENDYISCLSVITPRIESILRTLIDKKNGCSICLNFNDGNPFFSNKTFSQLLSSRELRSLFSDEMLLLLKGIFSNNYGLNIRNKIAHGLISSGEYTQSTCTLVLVVILYISSCNLNH